MSSHHSRAEFTELRSTLSTTSRARLAGCLVGLWGAAERKGELCGPCADFLRRGEVAARGDGARVRGAEEDVEDPVRVLEEDQGLLVPRQLQIRHREIVIPVCIYMYVCLLRDRTRSRGRTQATPLHCIFEE